MSLFLKLLLSTSATFYLLSSSVSAGGSEEEITSLPMPIQPRFSFKDFQKQASSKEISDVEGVLLHPSMSADDCLGITTECAHMGWEKTRLKAAAIDGFQFPEHIDGDNRAVIIKTFLRLPAEKIKTLTAHKFLFNWGKSKPQKNNRTKSDQYRRILEACAALDSAQIEAVGESLSLLHPEKRRREDLWNIATRCQTLTPYGIISRARAIHSHASRLFAPNMNKMDRWWVIRWSLALTPEQISNLINPEVIRKAIDPLFQEKEVMDIYLRKYILPLCQPLSLEEFKARYAALKNSTALLFFERMDDYNRGNLIEASLKLEPEQLQSRAREIHSQAALLLKGIWNPTVQEEIIRSCLSLSPDQIKALASHRAFFLREKRYGNGNGCAIKACKKLTAAQINDIGDIGLVLLPPSINRVSRTHIHIIEKYVELGTEQTRLKANAIGAFQFPEYVDDDHRTQIIKSLLELTVDQIEALVSHSALFVWPQMKPGESSHIIKACAKLTPDQITAIETSFSLLYPDKKQAGDLTHIITLCEKLEPEDIISRASSISSHVAPLVTERMSELARKEAIQECFTLTPEQIVAFASTDFFSPEKRKVLRIEDIINAYANLTPIQIKVMGKFSEFLLSSKMIREYDFRDIIETCGTLTAEQITDRTQALLENYSRLVLGNMDPYEHLGVMTGCLKVPSDKIRALALQAAPLLHQCSPAFGVFDQLTVEQIEATGRASPHLFLKEMDWVGYRSIMEACRDLTPQQIQLKAAAIHSQAALLFNEKMDQRARAGIIEGCLASLSPEQIEAIAPYRALFLPDTFGVWDYPPVIEACAKLTSEQIKEIGIVGSVLLQRLGHSDRHVDILKMCANLEVEQIRLKANAIGGFQFPEYIDSYDRANVIKALYKRAVEKIETLSSHRSLFFWEGEWLYDNLKKIKACAKLSAAQLVAVDTAFSLLYPEKKKAEDLISFVRQCQELTPQEIQSRAEAIHNNPSLFPSETKGPAKRSPIISACLKLTPDQIHAVALHAPSLFLEVEDVYDRRYKIEACAKMTVDKIKAVAESASQLFIEGMEEEAYHTIISECDGLSVEQIKALAVQAPKFFSKKPHKYECRDFVRALRPLSVDQIDALGEGSPYFLEYFRNLETIVKLYRNSSPDRIRMDAEKHRDEFNKEKQKR